MSQKPALHSTQGALQMRLLYLKQFQTSYLPQRARQLKVKRMSMSIFNIIQQRSDIEFNYIIIIFLILENMDLPYPTKKNNITQQLNELDKLYKSILLSTRDLPQNDALPKELKHKIKKSINDDKPFKLRRIIEEQAISYDVEMGARGSRWNVLHFCAKHNSWNCLHYLLRTHYQLLEEEYQAFVNLKTVEGYTPIVVAIINRAHKALEVFLGYGGIDIHVIDGNKMTPYEIALNYKNDTAIRLLMSYESTSKKKHYLNRKALMEPIILESSDRCCQSLWDCLFGCMTFGAYEEQRKNSCNTIKSSIIQSVKDEEYVDYVSIGSKKELQGYEIQWKRAAEMLPGQIKLFNSYNPFSIRENNFVIRNQIILFQSLSQQPWLLRKVIRQDRSRNNYYTVYLHSNKTMEKISIDDHVPFIKDRKEPMFFSSEEELWPMILQKGLAKLHHGYIATNQISPNILLQEITGFHTLELDINEIDPYQVYDFLQKLVAKSYIYFLKGKEDSTLCEKKGSVSCFNILNFYQKDQKQLVLINCPFIEEQWKKREKTQALALKLIKSHYSNPNQMSVWIEAEKLMEYFSKIVISLTFSHHEKTQLKIKTFNKIFCKFKIEQRREEPVVFQLSSIDQGCIIPLDNLEMMKNEGSQYVYPQKGDEMGRDLAYYPCHPGQYMFYFQVEQKYLSGDDNNLLIVCWSMEGIQVQFVEEDFGILEWFGALKNRFSMIEQKCVVECIGQISLIMLRQQEQVQKAYLLKPISELQILQGRYAQQGKVEMIGDQKNIFYCVVRAQIRGQELNFEYE